MGADMYYDNTHRWLIMIVAAIIFGIPSAIELATNHAIHRWLQARIDEQSKSLIIHPTTDEWTSIHPTKAD
jgi:hypothetical protein